MSKQLSLEQDLRALEQLAFKRLEKLKSLLTEVHRLLADPQHRQHHAALNQLRKWLCTSYTLWPGDYQGLGEYFCRLLNECREMDAQMSYLMNHLQELPSKEVREVVALKEKEVERGNYDPFLTGEGQRKKLAYEKELFENPRFQEEWKGFVSIFPQYISKKVLRRRFCMERNFRVPGFEFDFNNTKHVAMLAFDLFCYRWNLFGMEDGRPLLMKLSVNATPHGIMIVIPSYWSLDFKRDLNWKSINELHKSWGMMRQGGRWDRAEIAQRRRKAYYAKEEGMANGLRGAKLYDHIIATAGLPKFIEHANVRKTVREGEQLVKGLD